MRDLVDNGCSIEQYIADNLKRANARGCLNHSSNFPCEYCFAQATRYVVNNSKEQEVTYNLQKKAIQEKIDNLREEGTRTGAIKKEVKKLQDILSDLNRKSRKKSHLVMPSSTRHAEYRTEEKMKEILDKIEENPDLPANERKGVIRKSPLMELEGFDFLRDVNVEYMHALCIGVVKRLTELTFDVGENRSRITKRKLSSIFDFNKLMLNTKVPGEFPRRARELQFAVMKASEFRNLAAFFFIHVIECIAADGKERLLWLYLAYMIRSCILPSDESKAVPLENIDYCCENFYLLYEKLFGPCNCTYNTHVVCTHLIDMRYHGPLTMTSAFPFESFYGEIRNSFAPGTQSPLKQIFERILLKRALSKHICQKSLLFTNHDTSLECNTLVYTYKHSEYHIYKVVEITKEQKLICQEIQTLECIFKEVPSMLVWSQVGVFCEGSMGTTDQIVVSPEKVAGKVLRVGKYLITCPNDVLTET